MSAVQGTPAERAVRVAIGTVLVLGLWLRARGFLFSTFSLWLDEATWAIRLMDKPLVDNLIRPIGFMAVTKWLSRAFGPSETVLRLMPWLGGVATMAMSPEIARRLFRSKAAQLLFVSVIALHPAAIDLSKEFKPYAVGLAFHTALLFFALRYSDDGKVRDLVLGLGLALVAVLFAQDAIFAYPGFFLVLSLAAFKARRFRHLFAVVVSGAVTLAVVFCLYHFVWSRLNQPKEAKYWGKKYDVFYMPSKSGEDRTDWTAERYAELVSVPGTRRALWTSKRYSKEHLDELRSLDALAWVVLHMAGVLFIVRRKGIREGLLLALPLGMTTAFNVLGFWPLGEFRANLFALLYSAGIAAFGVDRDAKKTRWEDLLPAMALVLLPLFAFEREWHATKQMHSTTNDFPAALKKLIRLQGASYSGPREKLVVDMWGCTPVRYYTRYHPTARDTYGQTIRERMTLVCRNKSGRDVLAGVRSELLTSNRVWMLATGGRVIADLDHGWPDDLDRPWSARIHGDAHVIAGVTARAEAPAPEPAPTEAEPEAQFNDSEN